MVQIRVVLSKNDKDLPEYFIIELQGDLKSSTDEPFDNNFLGDLHFTKEGTPILIIGHHILNGKCTTLEKPLAVMVKSSDTTENDDMMDRSNAEPNKTHERKTVYVIKAIVKRKLLFKTRPKPIIANVTKVS